MKTVDVDRPLYTEAQHKALCTQLLWQRVAMFPGEIGPDAAIFTLKYPHVVHSTDGYVHSGTMRLTRPRLAPLSDS